MYFFRRLNFFCLFFCGCFTFLIYGDSFTHKTTGQVLHGYLSGEMEQDSTVAHTVQEGIVKLNLSQWNVSSNRLGRKNAVVIIVFKSSLNLQIVSDALSKAISESAKSGPLQVILEIDSPGGKTEYIEKLCDLIIRTDYCPISAFLCGGENGGALSGSAAVALACDEIYMAPNTTIGAATLLLPRTELESEMSDELKLSIAWEDYLTSLARHRNRPGLLARAMVDRNIGVIEILRNGKPLFISPEEKEPNDMFIKSWTKKGSLLTLTAAEARQCQIAEAIVVDRAALLQKLEMVESEIVVNNDAEEAARTFRKAQLKFARLRRDLDEKIRTLELTDSLPEAMVLLRDVKEHYKSLLLLARRHPDLYLDIELIEEQLGTAESYYERAKDKQRYNDSNSVGNEKGAR